MTWRTPRLIAVAIIITACSASISAQPEAVAELRAAAEQGDAVAKYNLGVMYAIGEGVPQDEAEAVRWWRLSRGTPPRSTASGGCTTAVEAS